MRSALRRFGWTAPYAIAVGGIVVAGVMAGVSSADAPKPATGTQFHVSADSLDGTSFSQTGPMIGMTTAAP